ncbi:hypothetical protein BFU36_11210 [Sulfolobus sp. A20]|nr:hypothetical protein BFU36_11210 [Sulfolobus sp. A20]
MFSYYGRSSRKVRELLDCLVKSAKEDKLYNNTSHGDGWGFVLLTKDKIFHYRSLNPIFEEISDVESDFPIKISDEEMMIIAHARQASDKSLVSSYYSHPYLESNSSSIFFLAHNGSVNKEGIANELGISAENMVDSELILKYIEMKGVDSINDLKKFTKSSLNLLLLEIRRKERQAILYYLNYYDKGYVEKRGINKEYYKLYVNEDDDGISVYSSTLAYYCKFNKQKPCEEGELIKIGGMSLKSI